MSENAAHILVWAVVGAMVVATFTFAFWITHTLPQL